MACRASASSLWRSASYAASSKTTSFLFWDSTLNENLGKLREEREMGNLDLEGITLCLAMEANGNADEIRNTCTSMKVALSPTSDYLE